MVSEISKILLRTRKFTWSCCHLRIPCKFELPDLLIPSWFKFIDFWITTWKNIASEASSFHSYFQCKCKCNVENLTFGCWMPFETQVCLKLFDNLKAGLLFKYLLHIHTDANQILSERYLKTHYLNKLQHLKQMTILEGIKSWTLLTKDQ